MEAVPGCPFGTKGIIYKMDLEKLALEAEENLKDIFADIDRTAYQNTARSDRLVPRAPRR